MPLTKLEPHELTESVLQALVNDGTSEGKTIDYKLELPSGGEGARKEFLADLSSFANAEGGHLVFGMAATSGVPTTLVGIGSDPDKAILRLEEMARDGIQPSISGVVSTRVVLANGRVAIVVSVPKSSDAPHQVTFQKEYRFYGRGSAGKHRMRVDELRRIILKSSPEHQHAIDDLAEDISWAIGNLLNRSPRPSTDEEISLWEGDFVRWCDSVGTKLENRKFFTRADQLHFERLGFVDQMRMTGQPKLD
jgi:predicted HTH transcriptional regulator